MCDNGSTFKQLKTKTDTFQGFNGVDKQDRTADLLNAIVLLWWTHWIKVRKTDYNGHKRY